MKKIFLSALLLATVAMVSYAQSGTNSPYSQFGYGILSEQTSGFNRGMNGLGLGFHEHNQVNYLNPASYASIDSLSFIFDAALSLQITNFKENGESKNAKNADLEYVVAGLRLMKHVGLSFGLIPFTNVGYNYSTTTNLSNEGTTTTTNTYDGSGGLHQVYLGAGWEPFKGFAIGANISYLWGTIDRSVINSYNDATVNTLSKYYSVDVRNYRLDLGAQYTARLSKKDWLTIGATYTMGHDLHADPKCQVISSNTQTGVADTTVYRIDNGLKLPSMYGVGFMWNHNNSIKVGMDYSLQQWGSEKFPQYVTVNEEPQYVLVDDILKDRHKFTFGGEYCPNEKGRGFFQRIHYRAGVSYATPYFKVNGVDGPKEISASMGFGIPIVNSYNRRSLLNISAQWAHYSATDLIKENTFRITVGITFNERWFDKWKVE